VAVPLIATKLYVPKLRRGLLARPRLVERLGRGAEARVVLVSAPAGFGKTTLLAAWFDETASQGRGVAWLSLDAADSEPASFWAYVVTALQKAVPGVGSHALELIGSSPLPTELMLTTLLNELAEAPGDIWLVLDDYHLVDGHDVGQGMAFLLEHLPPQVHVVICTRADPDLPLARWRVRGELVEIRAADLRFTSDETTTYLNEATGLDLPAHDVAALEERTEGWIAALQLAALSIRGRDDVSDFIARFAGNDRYLLDYLVEEVLVQQPEPVRDFLLHTAVLDRLTGPLCDAVTGGHDGSQMLTTLQRANLFVVPLDDQRQWYRYHHLFADVLRARLLAEKPDAARPLHQRASRWYEANNAPQEAVRHALAAHEFDRAAYLMELSVPAVRRNRQEAMMIGWLKELPDDTVRHSPVLSVFFAYMLMVSGDLAAAESRLEDAEGALAAIPDASAAPWADTDELRTLPATIAVYRASLAQARGDVTGTAAYARRALDLAGPKDHLARGSAAGFLGLAAWATGDVVDALETFTQAVASLHAAGNLIDELSSTVVLADMWLAAGRPSKARRLCVAALEVSEAHGEPMRRASTDLHVELSEMDYEVGDLESARQHLERAAPGDGTAMTESRFRWFVAMGRVTNAEGDARGAISLLDKAEQLYRPGFFPEVRPIAAMKARIWISQGDLSRAADWAGERGVSVTDEAEYLREFDHLTLVRLLLGSHRADPDPDSLDQALHLLARLREVAEASGRPGSLVEIHMLQALAQDTRGDRSRALELLGQSWDRSPEPDGYVRIFLDEGAPMMELLRDADHQGLAGDHARRLLSIRAAAERGAADDGEPAITRQRIVEASAEPLSERELQVLRLLDSELTGPEIARELFVSHNTMRTHTKHIFTKLQVTTRRAAVRRARELGLM
jgi:LuxR family maltose regulon positive regulatory protein